MEPHVKTAAAVEEKCRIHVGERRLVTLGHASGETSAGIASLV
jgi:hypothetical protein